MLNLIKQIMSYDSRNCLIERLQEFVVGCSYLSHEESKRRVCAYIECGCDNKKTLEKLARVTDSALRSTICYANSRLKTIVGENIILRISSGDKKAETIINYAYNRNKSDIIKGVSEKISSFSGTRYFPEDCKIELLFLARFCEHSLHVYLSKMDKHKLAYLKHCLTEPDVYDLDFSIKLREWLGKAVNEKQADVDRFIAEIKNSIFIDSEKSQ